MVIYTVGRICLAMAVILLLPALVAVIYGEDGWIWFLLTAAASGGLGLAASLLCKPSNRRLYAREGFAITALTWIAVSLIGALPFLFSGEIPNYIDCVFETVSGFTTTGSSIVPNPETLSRCTAFWRSFTQWLGGMGVLVFVLMVVPLGGNNSMHIMRAESPGPMVSKLLPRMADTAKILYAIYLVLTVLETVLLICGGMPVYDAIVTAFTTAGTGGYSVKLMSIAAYDSAYIDVVITVFMALFGLNFNVYFFLLVGNFTGIWKNSEVRLYIGILVGSMLLIAADVTKLYGSFLTALRYSSFQVSSIMTTTGFVTADFDLWPTFSKTLLILLMFIGACASSTGGGLKVQRVILAAKYSVNRLKKLFHPHEYSIVRLDGRPVSDETMAGVLTFFAMYIAVAVGATLIISLDGFSFEANFTAMATCLSNVGPGLGEVGPTRNFAAYSQLSKVVLSLAMLMGRLELFPMLCLMSPSLWKKRR